MVKVIKDNSVKRCICENCSSILEYTIDDVNSKQLAINEFDKFILCPACNRETRVNKEAKKGIDY